LEEPLHSAAGIYRQKINYGNPPLLRHQIIESLTAPHTEKAADTAIVLWERMATQIIAIIGVGGFNSLYARSLFLTQSGFPWLNGCELPCPVDQRFTALKNCLEEQAPGDALEANNRLLCTFTDILAALIGEALTSSILRSAWGDHAPAQDQQEVQI